jgi:integral membrane sensor domain MASE1
MTAAFLGFSRMLSKSGFNVSLGDSRDVLLLLGLGALFPSMISGLWTSILLMKIHGMSLSGLIPAGWLYGCAHTAGVVVITPIILMASQGRFRWKRSQGMEALKSLPSILFTITAAWLAFRGLPGTSLDGKSAVLAYLPFPFLVWTALSRGLPGASISILGIVGIAAVFTGSHLGPFANNPMLTGTWQLEVYIAVISSTGLLLGVGAESQWRERILLNEASVRKAELERVKAQIHPHFLFNCLTAIHSLVSTDPGAARNGISSLSSLLRNSLDVARESRIPVEKEMQIIRDALALQKMRFEDGLETSVSVDAKAESFLIAPMIIQPLVENAVKHGVVDGRGSVMVAASATMDWLEVTVTNTAPPGTDPSSWNEGVGLSSLRSRLLDTWGGRAQLSYAAISTGTVTASLRIPKG